jgi:PKD repeat protein
MFPTKKTSFRLIHFTIIICFFFGSRLFSQSWTETLPQDRISRTQLTLFDYQQAFNNYWTPLKVENAYYIQNGEKQKAAGWKQFKRWEWFWQSRVNPQTGEFPRVSAMEVFNQYLNESEANRSLNGNWTSMGPTSTPGGYAGLGRVNCVAFDPDNNNIMYSGAASGGVWKTTDGGSNWLPIGDFNAALGASDIIAINEGSNNILYLATGDRDHSDTYSVGVLKSNDGGTTWNTTGLSWTQSQGYIINRLIVDPSNNSILYAATNGGVFKTTNNGDSWTQINSNTFKDLEFNPGNSSIIYGSTTYGEVYRSINSGSNWNLVLNESSGRRTQLAVSADNSSMVYAVMANSGNGLHGVFKSTDEGASFTQVHGSSPNLLGWACDGSGSQGQGWYDLCIIADPNNANLLFVGGVNTWKSTDGGSNWNINNHWSSTCGGEATTVHADKHYFAYQNGSSVLFEGNDGGIYKTTNNGDSWTDITNTMVISQMYRLGVAQTVSNDVITGLQDNGTKNFQTNVWDDVMGGDGMECAINPSNANTQYGSLYYGQIRRTTDHWGSSTTILSGNSSNAGWVTPYVIDPNNNQTIYVGYRDVMKSTNQGTSWTTISSWNGDKLVSLTVAPGNSDFIFAATSSTIYSTSNAGSSWTNITANLPVSSASISYISVSNTDPNNIWVSLSGFNSHGVYQSTNGGANWTNISTGLPQLPVNCVIQNKLNTSETELYAGTDVGIYVKIGSANWTTFFNGLPNVPVTELEIYYEETTPANSMIRAATFGRGLWESDLYSSSGVTTPVADFEADNLTPTISETVSFTDLSTNTPTSWLWEITPNTYSFGGGTDVNSQNPIVIFNETGLYSVSLTATNAGGSNTEIKTDYIDVNQAAPVADFVADNLTPTTIEEVNFTDLSTNTPTSWLWEITPNTYSFGGGTDVNSQNPIVIFNETGLYSVSLTATNAGGSNTEIKTDYIDVSQALPVADFVADNLTPTTIEEVNFTDLSTNSPTSWLWEITPNTYSFGGGTDVNSQNPIVVFNETGLYSVSLTATNTGGSNTEIKTDYINVSQALPVADFVADNLTPTTIEEVNFTDLSTNTPTSWLWEITPNTYSFGGGTDVNSQNPIVIFNEAGLYSVSLTATNAGGSNTEIKTDYINVSQAMPVADFTADNTNPSTNMDVTFSDLSINNPNTWLWEFTPSDVIFTNGSNNTSQNPVVQFTENGMFTVSLTVSNSGGSNTEIKTDYIEVSENLSATASANPNEICIGETSQLNCLAGGGTESYTYSWSSTPEGFTSNLQNPVVNPIVTTTYSVAVNDGINTIVAETEVEVHNLPVITLVNWPEILCNQMEPAVQLEAYPEGGYYSGSNVTPNGIFAPETADMGWNVITYSYQDVYTCENSKQDSIYVDNCVGTEEINKDFTNIFPNPNSGNFKINSSKTIVKIEIVSISGTLVYSKNFNNKSVNINTILNKGVYYLRIYDTDGEIVFKDIVVK